MAASEFTAFIQWLIQHSNDSGLFNVVALITDERQRLLGAGPSVTFLSSEAAEDFLDAIYRRIDD